MYYLLEFAPKVDINYGLLDLFDLAIIERKSS